MGAGRGSGSRLLLDPKYFISSVLVNVCCAIVWAGFSPFLRCTRMCEGAFFKTRFAIQGQIRLVSIIHHSLPLLHPELEKTFHYSTVFATLGAQHHHWRRFGETVRQCLASKILS